MTVRLKSIGLPVLVLAAVALLGVALAHDNFFLMRLKTYSLPAGSMEPALQVGDMFVAEQATWLFDEAATPGRGDIVVFALPGDPDITYVKRLVGLPGDRLQMQDGRLFLNGVPLTYEKLDDYVQKGRDGATRRISRFLETLPDGTAYEVLDVAPASHTDTTREFVVPEAHMFVLGDNRDNSVDSRMMGRVGYVPLENLVGIARAVYFSGPEQKFTWRPVVAADPAAGSPD